MRNIFWIFLCLICFQSVAQDELSSEIDKLESGTTEESEEAIIPEQSAQEIEDEIQGESEEAFQEAAPAPEVLPDDLEPQAPMETFDEVPATQPAHQDVPAPETLDETFESVPEEIVQPEPTPEPPAPEEYEEEAPAVVVQESVDEVVPSDFENRLRRIYKQFYSEATTDEAWTQIVGDRVNETYTVQPGDTLWDISITFFGNGHFWPKMWQVNDEITNPHSISAGYILRFVPGQMDAAPNLQIVKSGTGAPNDSTANLEDPNTTRPEAVPVIPPPTKKYATVLENLPPSLPYIRNRILKGYDKDGFSVESKSVTTAQSVVYIPSYLSEEAPEQVGKIIDQEGEDRSEVGVYEYVYVRIDGGAKVGERVLVFDVGKNVFDVNESSYLGKPIYMQGELEIQDLINSEENVYKALVVKAINPIKVGSYISRQKLLVSDIQEAGPSTNVNANVVGGQFDSKRSHMGLHEVVYLDKGLSDGLKSGQILSILRNPEKRGKKSIIQDLSRQIAKVKVVQTTDKVSTALVLNAREDIRKGDFVGSLRTQALNSEVSSEESDPMDNPDSESDSEVDEFIDEE